MTDKVSLCPLGKTHTVTSQLIIKLDLSDKLAKTIHQSKDWGIMFQTENKTTGLLKLQYVHFTNRVSRCTTLFGISSYVGTSQSQEIVQHIKPCKTKLL